MHPALEKQLEELIRANLRDDRRSAPSLPLWSRLRELGTKLWLDTGDMDEAARLWTDDFTALTTNNTLLNREIQKGLYDTWIPDVLRMIRSSAPDLRQEEVILEAAFALNARHGLRLVERFDAFVSVELHTALAHDVERSVRYGERYHAICPSHFIVKVPLTAAGLIAARKLSDAEVPVNFTLGFSARQNLLITSVARPAFVNVFLGRLNAYVAECKLGDGALVGERAAVASQAVVRRLRQDLGVATAQIGASLRDPGQVDRLAGLDVMTIPLAVAEGFIAGDREARGLKGRMGEHYTPQWNPSVDPQREGLEDLWATEEPLERVCGELGRLGGNASPDQIREALADGGAGSLLPELSADSQAEIAAGGKLPERERWQADIAAGRVGLDALFTLAGLHAFAKDQAALDERIVKTQS